MIYHGNQVPPATARHAARYLQDAWVKTGELAPGPREAADAFEQVAGEITVPCRAIGVARQALRSARYDVAAAIKRLER
ncbi:MAG: hypothetical protein EPN31_09770 [Castellaniella sp.]|uniref:hypothetical protein n=1 Tax=Castellaniella sp. TaxID=1955812 RepID=UPI0012182DF9|nr:hypothetical protein [Castellaniella sp.]TAN27676.1 MAG: hypothetical protein EPN31_09770 [Castellaniella sp.]